MLSGPDCNCRTHLAIFLSSAWMQLHLIKLWRFLSFIARPGSRIRESKLRLAKIKLIQSTCWILTKTIYKRGDVTHMETHMCLYGAGAGQLYCYNKATISLNLKRGVAWNFHHFLQWYYLCQERVENLWDIRPSGQRASVCLPSLTYKNIGTLTWGHVWTHTNTHTPCPVLLPPACCWNCFPPSSDPGKAGFIVLTYLCVKSDCSVLYLCLYSDGETERESVEEGERVMEELGGGVHRSQASHWS